jgi:hypothetical protein
MDAWKAHRPVQGVAVEDNRTDAYTGQRFAFFAPLDGLPLVMSEVPNQSTTPST